MNSFPTGQTYSNSFLENTTRRFIFKAVEFGTQVEIKIHKQIIQ